MDDFAQAFMLPAHMVYKLTPAAIWQRVPENWGLCAAGLFSAAVWYALLVRRPRA